MSIESVHSISDRIMNAYQLKAANPVEEQERGNSAEYEVSFPELQKTVEGANRLLEPTQIHLQFELHEKLNEYFVKVVDNKTNEVIREIPPKKWLDFYAAMAEFMGLIVDKSL
ncbi:MULTISPECIES: flagellar protein FlaG [Bacillus]|uniref:flagellar protein FlaG n=1 Tax=Bacillus TaxID=1386 RepID=UPI000401F8AC|nr:MULTISPECIES: flagellar protein FlaG [Bacillus]QHZ45433.1 flagellar protein FlaG [Bacillus sp. NSP9.1]WFA04767.1 flagellar protein FlaG [Bacillus sp. HSf4]